jgi:integrase/recombinase XerD
MGSEMLFHLAADAFIHSCAFERQLSGYTLHAYSGDLRDFGGWLPKNIIISEIEIDHLKSYLTRMIEEQKKSPATIRRRFACLRSFFKYFEDLGLIVNPFIGWRVKLPRRKRLPRALSRLEISLLLSVLQKRELTGSQEEKEFRVAVWLMVSTGLRVGELCKLRVQDISPDGTSLRVHGKGSRDRTAYISSAEFRSELCQLVVCRRNCAGGDAPLLMNRLGSKLRPQSIRTKLRRAASKAGLSRHVTPHMLRHSAATLLIERGVDIRMVQRLLGHASIATTEIYTHVSDEALRLTLERANVLGGFVSPRYGVLESQD